MLNKVRDFPYVPPKTFSSALILLLTEVCKCHSLLSDLYAVIPLNCLIDLLQFLFIDAAFMQESSEPAS